jgi:glycosyltransferase involved in cell wall biosynthesis
VNTAPKVSVVVTTFNRPEFVRRAVESVLAQTSPSLECIVVDDHGDCTLVLPEDDRVRLLRRPANGGTAAARNDGLSAARGEYVSFLDDDDAYTPDRLELALAAIADADAAICWSRYSDGDPRPGRLLEGDVNKIIMENLVPNVGQVTVRRDRAPRFDERLRCCEDLEWWVRAGQTLRVHTAPHIGLLITQRVTFEDTKPGAQRAFERRQILDWHAAYFAARPRAKAFQLRRIGSDLRKIGDFAGARRVAIRALRVRVTPRTMLDVVRSLKRTRFDASDRVAPA